MPRALRTSDCVLDGVICALDDAGQPSRELLERAAAPSSTSPSTCSSTRRSRCSTSPGRRAASGSSRLLDDSVAEVRLSRAYDDGRALRTAARAVASASWPSAASRPTGRARSATTGVCCGRDAGLGRRARSASRAARRPRRRSGRRRSRSRRPRAARSRTAGRSGAGRSRGRSGRRVVGRDLVQRRPEQLLHRVVAEERRRTARPPAAGARCARLGRRHALRDQAVVHGAGQRRAQATIMSVKKMPIESTIASSGTCRHAGADAPRWPAGCS